MAGQRVPPPDWARYVMDSDAKHGPNAPAQPAVGDPTRWGAELDTLIPAAGIADSRQILHVQTRDAYSRSWTLFGTLSLPADLWVSATGVGVSLEIDMGVGQTVLHQKLMLFLGNTPAGSVIGAGALCQAQYVTNGGVYQSFVEVRDGIPILTRSFAAVGALCGQSINIRARYDISGIFAQLPTISKLALVVAPYAAGDKL